MSCVTPIVITIPGYPPPTEKKSFKKIEVRAVPSFILQLDYSVASQALSDCKLWKIGTIDPNDRNSFWC